MLATPLARRVLRQQVWASRYQFQLIDAVKAGPPVASRRIAQSRYAQTKAPSIKQKTTQMKSTLPKQSPAAANRPAVVQPSKTESLNATSADAQPTSVESTPVENKDATPASEPAIATSDSAPPASGPTARESTTTASVPPPAPAVYGSNKNTTDPPELVSAKELLDDQNRVLLYLSPRHGSLMVTSIIAGTAFISSCLAALQGILVGDFPLWLSIPTVVFGLLGTAIGVNASIVTLRCINKVELYRTPENEIKLMIEPKWRAYFWQPRRIDVSLDEIWQDRTIKDTDFRTTSVGLENRFVWTALAAKGDGRPPRETLTAKQRLKETWTQFKRDLLRSYTRVGMSRVRINQTTYKLDTYKSVMLDMGQPLAGVIRDDPQREKGIVNYIREYMIGF